MSKTLAYTCTGRPDGRLLVFLHGFLGCRGDWDEVVSGLSDSFRCMAIDLPGHGESTGLKSRDAYSFTEAATAVVDLIDEVGADSFSLIGYSMGGRLALYLATIYAMRIDRLVLESASPGLRTPAERATRRDQDEKWIQRLDNGDIRSFLSEWYRQPVFSGLHASAGMVEALIDRRTSNDPAELSLSLKGMGLGAQPSLWSEWEGNHVPTLLVTGERDDKFRGIASEMAEICRCARVSVVPGCGHNVHLAAPSDYTDLLNQFFSGL